MPQTKRMTAARLLASKYAPKPDGSSLTYGFISASLAGVILFAVSAFYQLDLLAHPVLLAGAAIGAFALGVGLRKFWKQRHVEAVAAEFAQTDPDYLGIDGAGRTP